MKNRHHTLATAGTHRGKASDRALADHIAVILGERCRNVKQKPADAVVVSIGNEPSRTRKSQPS